MNRAKFLRFAGAAAVTAAIPAGGRAAESSVQLTTSTGTIFGALTVPNASKTVPVVLIVAGSGPTDRDGNNALLPGKNDTYKTIAADLASAGIASLRYDKRGVAMSTFAAPAQKDLRFEMYVDDAAAWVAQLRADRRFSKIVVAGHSEGSLIGMIAAQRSAVDAFVSLEGAGRRASVVLLEQLKPQLAPQMFEQVRDVVQSLQDGKTAALPQSWPPALRGIFSPAIQPYLISWFAYDPAAEIAKVRAPVTIVQGTADVQVSMVDAHALERAAPRAHLVVVEGMNHMLRYYPDRSSQAAVLKGYEDAALPIDPKVIAALTAAA